MELAVKQNNIATAAKKQANFFGKKSDPPFFTPAFIQPKLTIGPVDDPYEREADAVADKVMRMSNSDTLQTKPSPVTIQPKCAECEEEEKKLQMKCDKCEEEEKLQRKCEHCEEEEMLQKKCASCEEEEKKLQMKSESIIQRSPPEESSPDLNLPHDWDERKRSPYAKVRLTLPSAMESAADMSNYGEANVELIERGNINPADFSIDYADLWNSNYQLSTQWGLGNVTRNLYDKGGSLLKPIRNVAAKIPWAGGFISSKIKLDKPKLKNGDWDRYVSDKLTLSGLGSALDRNYPAYNADSGLTFTVNIVDIPFDENQIVKRIFRKTTRDDDPQISVKDSHKCSFCEEDKKVQKKGEQHNSINETPQSVNETLKSSGQPIDEFTRSFMESRFGYDFSQVQIHNDSLANQSSSDINALAYTQGNHIVFSNGKYRPDTTQGRHLLAHELTHVVQQNNNLSRSVQRQLFLGAGGGYHGLMERDRNNAMQRLQKPVDAGVSKCGTFFANTEKQREYFSHRNDVTDLEGSGLFSPNFDVSNYVGSFWETGKTEVPVKVKFGSIAQGVIFVKKAGNYDLTEENINLLATVPLVLLDIPVIVTQEDDVGPSPENFQADRQIIFLSHPDLDTSEDDGTLVFTLEINSGIVTGQVGWINEKIEDTGCPIKDEGQVKTDKQSFVPLIYGIEHKDKKLSEDTTLNNQLSNGSLYFQLTGDLEADNFQKIHSAFILLNEVSGWAGKINTTITGAKDDELPLERTQQGYLSGVADDLQISKTWEDKGFKLDAGMHVDYTNGHLSVYGEATYIDKKGRGEGHITIVLTDEQNAERLFKEHSPVAAVDVPVTDDFLDSNLPKPDLRLSLTAWGNIKFKVTGKQHVLSGDASFVVSSEGYIITAGTLKLEKDYVLIDAFGNLINVFDASIPVFIFDLGPVYIGLYAHASLDVCYDVGSVNFKELVASGVYSNRPGFESEFTLAGTFDMPAMLGAKLKADLTAKLRTLGYTLVSTSFYVSGTFCMPLYLRATPSINYKKDADGNTIYSIKGQLDIQGMVDFLLKAGFSISVLKDSDNAEEEEENDDKQREWDKEILDRRWNLGSFDISVAVDYVLGSGELPKLSFTSNDLDKSDFLEALVSAKKRRAVANKPKGGFKEGKQQEGTVSDSPFETIHEDTDPLGPFAITDSFLMKGHAHTLFLEISGTEGTPVADIQMSSNKKRKFLPMLLEELEMVKEELRLARSLPHFEKLDETEIKKLEEAIQKLENIKALTEKEITKAVTEAVQAQMADSGLEAIGDRLTDYANLSGQSDLGKDKLKTPVTAPPVDGVKEPPPGVEVILILPKEKAIYLEKYRQYVKGKQLFHSLNRESRDATQEKKWNENQRGSMLRSAKCLGIALDLMLPSGADRDRNILRPYWTKTRIIGTNKAGEQLRMNVDHVVEWQVRPLTGGNWIDEPANFELLDPSANSSAGPRLDNNIEKTRRDLAKSTKDISWTTDDIRFTKVEAEGSVNTDRYSYGEIESGSHLNDFMKLTGAKKDKDLYKECLDNGGEPF